MPHFFISLRAAPGEIQFSMPLNFRSPIFSATNRTGFHIKLGVVSITKPPGLQTLHISRIAAIGSAVCSIHSELTQSLNEEVANGKLQASATTPEL